MTKEQKIIRLLHQRDKRAIAILYDEYAPALFGVVLRIVQSREIAEDVMQDAFIKIWKNGGNFDSEKGRLFTWLLNVARNTAIDATRSVHYKNRSNMTDLANIRDLRPKRCFESKTNHIGLRRLVNGLEYKYKEVVDLIYFNGYTQHEVAETLQIPLGTVKTRIKIALRELRKIFDVHTVSSILLFTLMVLSNG